MKRKTNRFLAFWLCALLLIPLPMAQGETSLSTDKIDADLLEMMEQRDILFPVRIDCEVTPEMRQDFDETDFEQYVEELKRDLSLEDATPVLSNEYYFQCWKDGYNFPRSVESDTNFPVLAVWLSEEEILRVAQHERVAMLYGYLYKAYGQLNSKNYFYQFGPIGSDLHDYDAESALRVLQWIVGLGIHADVPLQVLLGAGGYDVDKNKEINTLDALYMLQESVGLVTFGERNYLKSIRLLEPGMAGHEFEEARLPRGEFLFAPDLNEDGKADIIDLYLKYQDRLCAPLA